MDKNLDKILKARDERWNRAMLAIAAVDSLPRSEGSSALVLATMNIPGPEKDSPLISRSFDLALMDLRAALKGETEEIHLLLLEKGTGDAGPYAFFRTIGEMNSRELKIALSHFEESHPIGRWLDLDVRRLDGSAVSRENLSLEPRKCFLCDRNAKECSRSRQHSLRELLLFTTEALEKYVKER